MVAGPIERYERLGLQLREKYKSSHRRFEISYDDFSNGFRMILYGFFVKMVIADNLAPVVNIVYDDPMHLNSLSVITGLFFFSFQIYADFYGYSLIALGSARLMGINLINNFNTPYFARSISDFWHRWHISLSTWFRDYIYIPLGGSKVNSLRFFINILFVFALSGLWHGANFTFIIWGLLHGILYLIEYGFSHLFNKNKNIQHSLINILSIIKTFLLVTFLWIFFRSENIKKAKEIIQASYNNILTKDKFHVENSIWILLGLFVLLEIFLYHKRIDALLDELQTPLRWTVYAIMIFCVMAMSGTKNYPFIYFQF
jgi:D-alanyl-lipoteichoic acid acyltransferase DltB (MBOAT superfamily)